MQFADVLNGRRPLRHPYPLSDTQFVANRPHRLQEKPQRTEIRFCTEKDGTINPEKVDLKKRPQNSLIERLAYG